MQKPKPNIRIVAVSGQKKVGTIYLFGHFDDGADDAITSKGFIDDFQAVQSSDRILCKVHSSGGDVFLGNTIMDTLDECGKPVEFRIMGIAASMGYQVCLSKNSRIGIAKNGFVMVHWPSAGGGTSQDLKNSIKLLENIETEFATRMSARTGLTVEEVKAKYGTGDHWFNAQEALAAKLVDFIFDTTSDVTISDPTSMRTETLMARFTASLFTKKPIQNSMKKIIAHFGLAEGVSEETILASIKTLEMDRNNAKDSVTALTTQVNTLKASVEKFENDTKEARAIALVDKAVAEGRIGKGEREGYLALAKGSEDAFKGVENILNSKTARTNVVDAVLTSTAKAAIEVSADTWDKMHKAGTLDTLKKNDSETFKSLYKAKYGKEPVS